MITPTREEIEAFLGMQGRLVELILRHDIARFGPAFTERAADQETLRDKLLERYRKLAVLFYLRDQLFNAILPRIKRRLSFLTPRETQVEELPPRGKVDWARTTAANWRKRPGEPPLEVVTRQRRRHFATPENLLTVVTLLEYRQAAERLLQGEADLGTSGALRHPLNEIVHSCTRELVFPQFAGLLDDCQEIVSGYGGTTVEDLEHTVENNLLPGRNSAYNDLLEWRRHLARLRLLDPSIQQEILPALGATYRDNYLYQLWIFFEIADLLEREGRLKAWDRRRMRLTFSYRHGADEIDYNLTHDQKVDIWWDRAPGVRPDFYITRADRQRIEDDGRVIWCEPGYILDAKYYKPRDSDSAPSSPIKRMLGDLQLAGEHRGALLFAFQQYESDSNSAEHENDQGSRLETPEPTSSSARQPAGRLYSVTARPGAAAPPPDVQIQIWRLQPSFTRGGQSIRAVLSEVLEQVHAALKHRIEIRCRGFFLDTLSSTAHGALTTHAGLIQRDGQPLEGPVEDLLLCPKPHIAPWRVDIVSLSRDCCSNPALCHIKNQPGARKPERLTTLEQISQALRSIDPEADEEVLTQAATKRVVEITRRYADLLRPDMEQYQAWLRDELEIRDLFDTTPLLTDDQRETLALARFLWEQIEHIQATNYAGPTLLFAGVLEEVARHTIYKVSPPLYDSWGKKLMETLGTLGKSIHYHNSRRILELAVVHQGHWESNLSAQQRLLFGGWLEMVNDIAEIRNKAAHQANVSKDEFRQFRTLYFGGRSTGYGIFNGLLLAWRGTRQ